MTPKGVDLFVSDAGPEVSVRTSRDFATSAVMIEPLYASDIEALEGATGELRAQGRTLRGTLRRQGGAFMLLQEEPLVPQPPAKAATAPLPAPVAPPVPVVPVPPAVAAPSADPAPQADPPAPPDIEVLDAAVTVSRFVRGESGLPLDEVKRAHAVIGRFITERERQARPRK